MVRAGTVVAMAMAIGALAVIGLVMGVFAALPPPAASTSRSCGHLLDPAYRTGSAPAGCHGVVHDRRIEVAGAAIVAGAAALVGVTVFARADRDG